MGGFRKVVVAVWRWAVSAGFGVFVLVLLGVGFVVVEHELAGSYSSCVDRYVEKSSASSAAGGGISLLSRVRGEVSCTAALVDRHGGFFSSVLTLALVVFTFTLWRATDGMLRAAESQGSLMVKSVGESSRSADAMEHVAGSTNINTGLIQTMVQWQMRAYLSVTIGSALFQVRANGLKFEARPMLKNTGYTPARQVQFKIRAQVCPVPLPPEFAFTLPSEWLAGGACGPQQAYELGGVVDSYVEDDVVEDIKHAKSEVLCVWGVVKYEDVFGRVWETKFAQALTWFGAPGQEAVRGYYLKEFNDMQ